MSKKRDHARTRWRCALFGLLAMFFAGLTYAWSVMSVPIAREFSTWSAAQLSMTFTLVMIFFCLGALGCGFLSTYITPKVSLWISALLFFGGFWLTANMQSIMTLYLGFGVACGFASGIVYNSVMTTVPRWFPDKTSLISGLLLMAYGIGSFIAGKLFQSYTSDVVGAWRGSFLFLAILVSAVLFISGIFIVKPGEDAGGISKTEYSSQRDVPPAKLLRSSRFWMVYVWTFVLCGTALALISQAGSIVREVNPSLSDGSVATIVGTISIFNGIGRVLMGGMYDSVGRRKTMNSVCLLFTGAIVLFALSLYTGSLAALIGCFVLAGLGYGGTTLCVPAFIRSNFGQLYFPINYPITSTNLIVASFGSVAAGTIYDRTSSYMSISLLFTGLLAVACLCNVGIGLNEREQK